MKTEAEKTGPAEGEGNRRRIARLESLRRVLLVLGTLILLGGLFELPAARDVRLGAAPAGGGPGDLSDQVY